MKTIFQTFLFVALGFLLNGCNNISDEDIVYEIQNADASLEDVGVFIQRMNEFPVSYFSDIEYDSATRQLKFKNGIPDEQIVSFMSQNLGQLLVYSDDKFDSWITTDHIARAYARVMDEKDFVYLRLTEEGGLRMNDRSSRHIGKKVTIELDGMILMTPILYDQMGTQFLFSPDLVKAHPQWVAVLVSHGSMKNPLNLSKVEILNVNN